MKTQTVFNLALAALMCLALGCAWMLDGPVDIEALADVAADVTDAQSAAAAARLDVMRQVQAAYQP